METTDEYLFKQECYQIIGCCMEVHKELGHGFLEPVYQEALAIVFLEKGIPFEKEKILEIYFRERILTKKYIADFVCYNEIIVELKALEGLTPEHTSQVLNYLKATGKKLGLIVNFGKSRLEYRRVIL
jgi:GxxExxY protein